MLALMLGSGCDVVSNEREVDLVCSELEANTEELCEQADLSVACGWHRVGRPNYFGDCERVVTTCDAALSASEADCEARNRGWWTYGAGVAGLGACEEADTGTMVIGCSY